MFDMLYWYIRNKKFISIIVNQKTFIFIQIIKMVWRPLREVH